MRSKHPWESSFSWEFSSASWIILYTLVTQIVPSLLQKQAESVGIQNAAQSVFFPADSKPGDYDGGNSE